MQVRAAVLLDEHGDLAGQAGGDGAPAERLRELTEQLFRAADAAGERAGVDPVGRVEVSRPDGGVFGLRDADGEGRRWAVMTVAAAGALSSLMLYDMRMAIRAIGSSA